MKTALRIALLAVLLSAAFAGTGRAAVSVAAGLHIGPGGRASVDLGFFYDDLAPYGHWLQRPHYGWVWIPRAVAVSWRPYELGHWVWTDYGWTWISDEPFGWATYHYGRWVDDPEYGWEWIPGDDWGPAWVDWQVSDDYIGWAPLPPSYEVFRPRPVALSAFDFVFVPQHFFLSARVGAHAVPLRDCERIYHRSRNYTRYERRGHSVFNQGVPVSRVQRAVGRRVARYQVTDLAAGRRHRGARIAERHVAVFRPHVRSTRVAPPPSRRVARRAVISAPNARVLTHRRVVHRREAIREAAPRSRQERRQVRRQAPPRQVRPQEHRGRQVRPPEHKVRPPQHKVYEVRPPVRQTGRRSVRSPQSARSPRSARSTQSHANDRGARGQSRSGAAQRRQVHQTKQGRGERGHAPRSRGKGRTGDKHGPGHKHGHDRRPPQ
jgi:Family of unknown function (DUF6600)